MACHAAAPGEPAKLLPVGFAPLQVPYHHIDDLDFEVGILPAQERRDEVEEAALRHAERVELIREVDQDKRVGPLPQRFEIGRQIALPRLRSPIRIEPDTVGHAVGNGAGQRRQ